jgi:hypothetical protein
MGGISPPPPDQDLAHPNIFHVIHGIPHTTYLTRNSVTYKKKTHCSRSNLVRNLKYITMVYENRGNLQIILSFGRRAVALQILYPSCGYDRIAILIESASFIGEYIYKNARKKISMSTQIISTTRRNKTFFFFFLRFVSILPMSSSLVLVFAKRYKRARGYGTE